MNWLENIGQDLPQEDYINTLNLPSDDDKNDEMSWRRERLGKVTSSTFGDLFNKSTKGLSISESKTAKGVLYRAAWERLIQSNSINEVIETRTSFISKPTTYGNENEGAALMAYQEHTGNEIDYDPFKFYKFNSFIGGTPDSLVVKDVWKSREGKGIIEAKCPYNGGNHVKSLVEGNVYDDKHWWQCQGNMFVTGLNWCDYITYDDSMPEGLKLNIISITKDDDAMKFLSESIKIVENKILEIIKELENECK